MNDLKISWKKYYTLIEKMISEIEKKYFDYKILAISRGGLIPATLISHRINQSIDVIDISSYESKKQNHLTINNFSAYNDRIPNKILIVDDLIDSGNTLMAVLKIINNKIIDKNMFLHDFSIVSTVLIDKSKSFFRPSYSAIRVKKTSWIKFPYEKD